MDILLRPWRETDAAACAALADDEGVAANLRDVFPYPYTEQDARDFIALCLAADPDKALYCAVEVDGAFAGSISLTRGGDIARKALSWATGSAGRFGGKASQPRLCGICARRALPSGTLCAFLPSRFPATARPAACWRKMVLHMKGQSG